MANMRIRASSLREQYLCGDIEDDQFRVSLLAILSEQLVWASDLEARSPIDWEKTESDVGALWELVIDYGHLGVSWRAVRDNAPLAKLFNAVISQEIREGVEAGIPLSLHSAIAHSIALICSNGFSFPVYGAPISLPNSDWLSPEALDWLRRRESATRMKRAVSEGGGHMQLKSSAMDPQYLKEPLRSEVIGYLKANGHWK